MGPEYFLVRYGDILFCSANFVKKTQASPLPPYQMVVAPIKSDIPVVLDSSSFSNPEGHYSLFASKY